MHEEDDEDDFDLDDEALGEMLDMDLEEDIEDRV